MSNADTVTTQNDGAGQKSAESPQHGDGYSVAGDALIAVYFAGSITVFTLVPFQDAGFLGVPAAWFRGKALISPIVAFVPYLLLFSAVVVAGGFRLLLRFECVDHNGDFASLWAQPNRLGRSFERVLRGAILVSLEALLLFAKAQGAPLLVAIVFATTLTLLWDLFVLWRARHVAQTRETVSCGKWTKRWLRWDIVSVVTALLMTFKLWAESHEYFSKAARDGLTFGGAAAYGACSVLALFFDIDEHRDLYKQRLRMFLKLGLPLSAVFVGILYFFEVPLHALQGLPVEKWVTTHSHEPDHSNKPSHPGEADPAEIPAAVPLPPTQVAIERTPVDLDGEWDVTINPGGSKCKSARQRGLHSGVGKAIIRQSPGSPVFTFKANFSPISDNEVLNKDWNLWSKAAWITGEQGGGRDVYIYYDNVRNEVGVLWVRLTEIKPDKFVMKYADLVCADDNSDIKGDIVFKRLTPAAQAGGEK